MSERANSSMARCKPSSRNDKKPEKPIAATQLWKTDRRNCTPSLRPKCMGWGASSHTLPNEKKWKRPTKLESSSALRRTTSLIHLTPQFSSLSESSASNGSDCQCEETIRCLKEDERRWKVLYCFCRNVCRKKKHCIDSLTEKNDSLTETVSKQNIQISLLKSIIRSDETIRETWKKSLNDVKQVLSSTLKENIKLKNEYEDISLNIDRMKERISQLETDNNNYKNTHIILKAECSAFEMQLKKERDSNSQLKFESQLQMKKFEDELDKKQLENEDLKNEILKYEGSLEDKTFILAEFECNLQETTRLWQNSVKEMQQLGKEIMDLRKVNKTLEEQKTSLLHSLSLFQNNQEEIYKYLNLNVE